MKDDEMWILFVYEASLPTETCEPRSTFKKDCNTCTCSDDGKTAVCTLKACLSPTRRRRGVLYEYSSVQLSDLNTQISFIISPSHWTLHWASQCLFHYGFLRDYKIQRTVGCQVKLVTLKFFVTTCQQSFCSVTTD
jgi:hypothetical protein